MTTLILSPKQVTLLIYGYTRQYLTIEYLIPIVQIFYFPNEDIGLIKGSIFNLSNSKFCWFLPARKEP